MSLSLSSSTLTSALPVAWVERLFERMLLEYGKKFTDLWAAVDPDTLIAHWSRGLAGYSGAELNRGLDALSSREWPPTLAEFKKLCRPLLDPAVAYQEAVAGVQARQGGENGKWSHPAIYWAAMPLSLELRGQTYSQMKIRWEAALTKQLNQGQWDEIPQPMVALPAPGKTKTNREEASRRLRELARTIKVPGTKGELEVLERETTGEAMLPIQSRFAGDASDMKPAAPSTTNATSIMLRDPPISVSTAEVA